MDAKKSGIRLRHLEQHVQVEKKRDASPNPSNRKKIFEKLPYQKQSQRQQVAERMPPAKLNGFEQRQSPEFQQLVQNLKRKSMQLELRDNMIQNLNRQIDELKRDLVLKEKEVNKLKGQVSRLQRINRIAKDIEKDNNVFESFRDPEPLHKFSTLKGEDNSWSNIPPIKNEQFNSHLSTQKFTEEITMMNLMKPSPSAQFRQEEPQILSPFMALTNKKVEADSLINQIPIQRDYSHTFHGHPSNGENSFDFQENGYKKQNKSNNTPFQKFQSPQYSNTSYSSVSNFHKKPVEYEFLREQPKSRKMSEINKNVDNFNNFNKNLVEYDYTRQQPKSRKMSQVNKNVDKFNIFGQNDMKAEIRNQSKLQIDDSREFKFEDFDRNDF